MATVHTFSGPPSAGGSSPRGPTYHLATREISPDFTEIGPDQNARDLGPVDGARFLQLLEKLVAFDVVKLVDADPQLFVTVKSGRFLIQPQSGKLLVRPTNALDQIFFKLSPAEIPPFLDGVPIASAPAPAPTTLIGAGLARAEASAPPPASAPAESPAPTTKSRRPISLAVLAGGVVMAGGLAWFFLKGTPPPAPAPKPPVAVTPPPATTHADTPPEFDPIASPTEIETLRARFTGTYASKSDTGERTFELRGNGTFRYQEFGANRAVTKNQTGPYTFAFRHGTQIAVIRAPALGPIEIRGYDTLFLKDALFTLAPAGSK